MAVTPIVEVYTRIITSDANGVIADFEQAPSRFGLGVPGGAAPIDQEYSIGAGLFQALTVPAGARLVAIRTTAPSLTLKGITGDSGVSLTPATNVLPIDIVLPVSSPSIGILNGGSGAAAVRCVWF